MSINMASRGSALATPCDVVCVRVWSVTSTSDVSGALRRAEGEEGVGVCDVALVLLCEWGGAVRRWAPASDERASAEDTSFKNSLARV